jgi:hypothetical protein
MASTTAASAARKPDRPNVILLLGDDHRWDALSCMGNRAIHTPHLDQLSADGITFHNHFCTTAICCVSRASIFLGQYAGTHRIENFKTPPESRAGREYVLYEELYDEKAGRQETKNLSADPQYTKQLKALSRYHDVWKHSLQNWIAKTRWVNPIKKNDLVSDCVD